MSYQREQAVEVINRLYQKNRITTSEYETIFEALDEFETLRDRDAELEELWERFGDITMNPETECIEEPFLGWGEGIHREEIWHWFDERHSKGVAYLLYGEQGKLPEKIYELAVDWVSDFDGEFRTKLYAKEEDAARAMQSEIVSAMEDYDLFDEKTGELIDEDWVLEKDSNSWELYEKGYYSRNHCTITLSVKSVSRGELK